MSFISRIWKTLFPTTVTDTEFGILWLDSTPSFEPGGEVVKSWRGKARFSPLNHSVAVTFIAESEEGPSSFQRQLYHSVEQSWDQFRDELAERLTVRIQEWYGDASRAEMPLPEQFFQECARLDGVVMRESSRRLRDVVDVDLDFSVLSGALTNPTLAEMQDHYPSAQLLDGEIVSVEWH